MMPGFISNRVIASAWKGRKMGTAAAAKPDITHDHISIAQGKTIRKVLQASLAFQSLHNPLAPASNSEKIAKEPFIDRGKGRGCSGATCYLDTLHDVGSGSERDARSVCLADMVHEFIEGAVVRVDTKCGRARCNCQMGTCDGFVEPGENDNEDFISTIGGELLEILQGLVAPCISEEEHMLLSDVKKASRLVTEQADRICEVEGANCSKGCLNRALMKNLRDAGYNAAICKSKLDHNIGFPGGQLRCPLQPFNLEPDFKDEYLQSSLRWKSHSDRERLQIMYIDSICGNAGKYYYIDVVLNGSQGKEQRLIVDTKFQCQFEIARPTDQYASILQELPLIFVGKLERLQQIVNLMSEAMKASLRKRCMPLPPWRKVEYMRAKWFSPYTRTTNAASNYQRSRTGVQSRLLAHTAMKGLDWDIQVTNKLKVHLEGAADQTKKGIIGFHQLGIKTNMFDEHGLGIESWAANKPRLNPDQITVITTDWQPPAVTRRYSEKKKKIATLGLVVKEFGSTNSMPNPQQRVDPEN